MVLIHILESKSRKLLTCANIIQIPPTSPDHVICAQPDLLPLEKAVEIAEAIEKSQTSGVLDDGRMWQANGNAET